MGVCIEHADYNIDNKGKFGVYYKHNHDSPVLYRLGGLYGRFFIIGEKMSKKCIVYIDGLNLYYGILKHTKLKWLNLEKYFTLLRQDDKILEIKYFTAEIKGSHKPNQEAYFLALATLSRVKIILGKFKSKKVKCETQECNFKGKIGSFIYQKKNARM